MSVTTIDAVSSRPDPEVRPPRRSYTPKYKLQILAEIDAAEGRGGVGEILRREGLYSSLISEWRKQRERGALEAMSGRQPGRKGKNPLVVENARLRKRVDDLTDRLDTAEELIEAQGKVSALLQEMSHKSAEES
jgi:transposase